ncbi:hypothetical protein BC829DRAFT_375052 [Chytridium lagenaria]|nr:hypothetical protein BC829DRAFT_375052 [Chytridium lagenaria]
MLLLLDRSRRLCSSPGPAPGGYLPSGIRTHRLRPPPGAPLRLRTSAAPYTPAPPAGNIHADQTNILLNHLTSLVKSNHLETFYPPQRINELAQRLGKVDFTKISTAWRIPLEIAFDLSAMALYDVVFYCDDSGSMKGAENGTRIDDMKVILERVAEVATVFDEDGISIRFMNDDVHADHIRRSTEVTNLLTNIPFKYTTPLGTELKKKVLEPFVLQPVRSGRGLSKPVLVIIVTDGEPHPEPRIGVQERVVEEWVALKTVSYQFAQCGRDLKAQEFLSELDSNATIGDVIDAVSYYELEAEEYAKKGVDLTPELYLVKLCVGSIDPSYDAQDEDETKKQPQYAPPPAQYYAPPPVQQYAPPSGGYPGAAYGQQQAAPQSKKGFFGMFKKK